MMAMAVVLKVVVMAVVVVAMPGITSVLQMALTAVCRDCCGGSDSGGWLWCDNNKKKGERVNLTIESLLGVMDS
jgi:hypothetical protein